MYCTIANLDAAKLQSVQSLEKKLGKTILAFTCKDASVTALKDDELAEIKETEKKLGVTLVAYQ